MLVPSTLDLTVMSGLPGLVEILGELLYAAARVHVDELSEDLSLLVGDTDGATIFPHVDPYIVRSLHLPFSVGLACRRHPPIRAPWLTLTAAGTPPFIVEASRARETQGSASYTYFF